jgi:NADPH:quinone reductase-like Zn-dependent oxidoreductase
MKALGLTEFGGPDVLKVVDLPLPEPGPGEVRIRVHAVAVNPAEARREVTAWPSRVLLTGSARGVGRSAIRPGPSRLGGRGGKAKRPVSGSGCAAARLPAAGI